MYSFTHMILHSVHKRVKSAKVVLTVYRLTFFLSRYTPGPCVIMWDQEHEEQCCFYFKPNIEYKVSACCFILIHKDNILHASLEPWVLYKILSADLWSVEPSDPQHKQTELYIVLEVAITDTVKLWTLQLFHSSRDSLLLQSTKIMSLWVHQLL